MPRDLDGRRAAPAGEPRRTDAGVVEHHQVAGAQQAGQLAERPVPDAVRADLEQARRIARRDRARRDQRARQIEIEGVDLHNESLSVIAKA